MAGSFVPQSEKSNETEKPHLIYYTVSLELAMIDYITQMLFWKKIGSSNECLVKFIADVTPEWVRIQRPE